MRKMPLLGRRLFTMTSVGCVSTTCERKEDPPAAIPQSQEEMLVEGARRSSMDELADWTSQADKVVTF
jgi:sulfur relay (sulfurtransferase) complex TusBCD TusD component (DsrE family)